MIARLVSFCTRHHWLVIAGALLFAVLGLLARRSLSADAIPDLSDPQLNVVVEWMGHPAAEVAERITRELTRALDGIPGASAVRGSSMAGMASVAVVFEDTAGLRPGRAAMSERLAKVRSRLPPEVRVELGPLASSTGWVFQYLLVDPTQEASLLRLRRLEDTLIRPALMQIPGVADVAAVGGSTQEALVEVSSEQLRAHGVAFTDVVSSLRKEARGAADLKRLRFIPIEGAPEIDGMTKARLGDLAELKFDSDLLAGYADYDGELPALGGIVIAERGADPAKLSAEVARVLRGLRDKLTPGNVPHQRATVKIVTAYDRLDLVTRVSHTLTRALLEEIGVVVLVILMFLLHGRSALLPLATLPFVLLLTFGGMWLCGMPATIMSLGGIGIALGMAVDADVVALEACHRRLEALGAAPSEAERRRALTAAAASFTPAIITSLCITALSFLPVLAFTGETGRLLRPLAATKTLVIVAAAAAAVTLGPALRARLLSGRVRREFDNPLTAWLVRLYRPFVHFALRRPALTLVTAAFAVLSC
ncbi:MAG TPA: efflux RND transporter permease subunit, partial [Polyangiaceae bacterium]|nr:efflux RND transporter permease subunit [Polyangiaceae bacterium]